MRFATITAIFLLMVPHIVMADEILFHRAWNQKEAQNYIDRLMITSNISPQYLDIVPKNNQFLVVYSGPRSFVQVHTRYPWVEKFTQTTTPGIQKILPEIVTQIALSNSHINRIAAPPGKKIKDVILSPGKGITAQIIGSNIFVSFDIMSDPGTGEHLYRIGEAQVYVILEDNTVYPLMIVPQTIHGRTVHLSSYTDQIKKTLSCFKGMPFEYKVLTLVKAVLSNNMDDRLVYTKQGKTIDCFNDMGVFFKQCIALPGEGLEAKEFILELKQGDKKELTEKMLLVPKLATFPVSITLNRRSIEKNQPVRLIIVERKNEAI